MYIYSQVKKGTFPTIENLQKASESADITNGVQTDSRPLYYVLQKIANNAPRVSGIMTTRKTAVTSYDWKLKPIDSKDEQKSIEKTIALKKNINSIINSHTDINVFGQYLSEIIYDVNSTNPFTIKKFALTDFQKISDNKVRIYSEDSTTFSDTEIIPNQTKYLFATDGRLEYGGEFASIAKHAIYLNDILSEWNLIVKRVKGIAIGSIDADKMDNNIGALQLDYKQVVADLESALNGIGDTTKALQTLNSVDIKLSSLVDSSAVASLVPYKESLVADIAIALLGQSNTTELPNNGGSRAALQVLNLIRQDIIFSDINNIKKIVNDFLRIEWQLTNGNDLVPYEFDFVFDDVTDSEMESRKLQYIVGSGISFKVKSTELYEKLNYTMPDGTPEFLDLKVNNQIVM